MATCYNSYTRQYYYCRSRWSNWGRWVSLAVIVIVAFLFFFLCACISQRRRRKAGRKPMYATGWTQRLPGGGPPPAYNPNYNQQQPPQYGQPNQTAYQPPQGHPQGGNYNGQNQGYGDENQGYYGQRDVEMNATGANNFAPPSGPPPAKVH